MTRGGLHFQSQDRLLGIHVRRPSREVSCKRYHLHDLRCGEEAVLCLSRRPKDLLLDASIRNHVLRIISPRFREREAGSPRARQCQNVVAVKERGRAPKGLRQSVKHRTCPGYPFSYLTGRRTPDLP